MCLSNNQAAVRQADQANHSVAPTVTLARAARVLEALLENTMFDGTTVLLQFETRGQAFEIVNEARETIKATRKLLKEVTPC
jgi:hypothetical protein